MVEVAEYQLGFGRANYCGGTHLFDDCADFGWDCRCGVAEAGDFGYVDGQSAHALQTCGDVQPTDGES